MTEREPSPITVRKTVTWLGRVAWLWECSVHVHSRGYHRPDRRLDRYLARLGKKDRHPWQRCMDGANNHYHRYHSTGCHCSVRQETA